MKFTELSENIQQAIAKELGYEVDDLRTEGDLISVGSHEWTIYTNEEAYKAAKDYIKESVWAFKPSSLENMTEIPKGAFDAIQSQCGDANETILKIIEKTCGLDEFVYETIEEDGKGAFLADYDGEEIELHIDGEYYYLYRTN